jgi:N4-gp56 family major capsid protein
MTELKNVKEYIDTDLGTEGSLLIVKKIADKLVEEVDKNLIPRSEAAMVFGPGDIPGSSIDVDLETPDSLAVRVIAEGAEFPLDATEYTSFNLKPVKYGVAVRITKEMLEDGKWNLLDRNVMIAGKRMAENETSLIISDALDNANTTVSGGAAITISDITTAMQNLEDQDYSPTTMFVGMEVLNDLRNIDTFVEANKVGNTDMLSRGFLGTIYGMNVIKVSSNAGMTATSAYVTDKENAYVMAIKRDVSIEGFDLPTFDMKGAVVSCRIKVRQLRAKAISKITTS